MNESQGIASPNDLMLQLQTETTKTSRLLELKQMSWLSRIDPDVVPPDEEVVLPDIEYCMGDGIFVRRTSNKGLCVFTTKRFKAGQEVIRCPVLVMKGERM